MTGILLPYSVKQEHDMFLEALSIMTVTPFAVGSDLDPRFAVLNSVNNILVVMEKGNESHPSRASIKTLMYQYKHSSIRWQSAAAIRRACSWFIAT